MADTERKLMMLMRETERKIMIMSMGYTKKTTGTLNKVVKENRKKGLNINCKEGIECIVTKRNILRW